MIRKIAVLLTCVLTIGQLMAADSSLQGAWETVVQGLRKSSGVGMNDMDVQLPGGGGAHVRYSLKNSNAPLVLVLSGTFGRADNPYSDDLARELIDKGCNVVTMDSFFCLRYMTQTRHGAPGNLRNEAMVAGNVLQEMLRRADKPSEISVVGVSYGGGVALQMALLDQAGKLPVKLSHVVAFSVPLSFREAMQRLDDFEDLPYSYDTIVPIVKAVKPGGGIPAAVNVEQLEKVLGRGFKLDLSPAVDVIDRLYAGQIVPSPGKAMGLESLSHSGAGRMEREVEASSVTFRQLYHYWLAPYWVGKGAVKSEDELADFGEVALLLPNLGKNVEIIFARNDPLNDPATVSAVEKIQTAAHVTVLNSGGHAGFVRTEQGRNIVRRLFSESVAVGQ